MTRRSSLRGVAVLPALVLMLAPPADAETIARGVVYLDANSNSVRDPGEAGLPWVRVSNGRDVVATDASGGYELTVDDDDIIFVIKPRDYMTPVNKENLPLFYYVHKPEGSPSGLHFPGVRRTGPLPESVDFPLMAHPEGESFRVVVFGDTQPRNVQEVDYFAADVASELVGVDAAFGITLGDVVFDDLSVFEPHNVTVSAIGLPWYNVLGNHDENYDVKADALADETWERIYGPATYSFDWGPVHFIVLDDVYYDGDIKKGQYHAELTEEQLAFITNDLKHVSRDTLVVPMMHIPFNQIRNLDRLFGIIGMRPHVFSISAHMHVNEHMFFGFEKGWPGIEPHHHYNAGTACGSWWTGSANEFGIPHATMSDGTPNGYSILTFTGTDYTIRYKAAGRPVETQMHIHGPSAVKSSRTGTTEIFANVWNGSARSKVEMRVGSESAWRPMNQVFAVDPYFRAMKDLEETEHPPRGRKLPDITTCSHLWTSKLPVGLEPGAHVIEVRSTDMFGQVDVGRRIIRVK